MLKHIIPVLFEVFSVVLLADTLENHRGIQRKYLILLMLSQMIVFLPIIALDLPGISTYIAYIFFYLYIKVNYRYDFLHSLVLTIISLILAISIEAFTGLSSNLAGLYDYPYLFSLFAAFVFFVVTLLLYKFAPLYKIMELFERWNMAYAAVVFLSLVVFVPLTAKKVTSSLTMGNYLYIFVCLAVMWVLISQIQKYKTENTLRKQYYEGYTDVISQIRKSQHKFKNQIGVMLTFCETCKTYDELVKSQKEYMGRLRQYDLPNEAIVLEEPAVVSLIYEKMMEAYEHNIEVESSFLCNLAKTGVSDIVWVEILGVILDNAIEAICEQGEGGKMWISFREENRKVLAQIVNTYRSVGINELTDFAKEGYTTKGNGHGIGLHHISQIIWKNHGELIIEGAVREDRDCVSVKVYL